MSRKPLYYFNTVHGPTTQDVKTGEDGSRLRSIWNEIEKTLDSITPSPVKMYNEGLFTFNNMLIVIPPADVPKALDELYAMPEGHNKKLLLKLAAMGTSLVPCEERELLTAWRKGEAEMMRKEAVGVTVPAEEIGCQSVFLLTRNKVIGQVIAQTLSEDEAGVLFLNSVHNLKGIATGYFRSVLGLNVIEMNPNVRRPAGQSQKGGNYGGINGSRHNHTAEENGS